MPERCASSGVAGAIARPSSMIRPASGDSTPVSSLISVDLPAPFWPISAWISPARSKSPAPSSAMVAPKRLHRPSACSTTPLIAASVLAVGQFGSGLVPGKHAFLHHDAPGHGSTGVHVVDEPRQLRAQQRIAFYGGIELARLHRLKGPAHAVDGDDVDVFTRLQAGLLDRLDGADGHVVVVREQHIDLLLSLGLDEGFHHFLALGAR